MRCTLSVLLPLSFLICTCEPSLWGKACDEEGRCLSGYVCDPTTNRCVRPGDLQDGGDASDGEPDGGDIIDDVCSDDCSGGCPSAGCCTQECAEGSCPPCPAGCSCDLSCRDANRCTADCADGSFCHLVSESGSQSDMTCGEAQCIHECTSTAHCTLDCPEQSTCELICVSTGSCELTCGEEASCLISCAGVGNCTVDCDNPVDCGNGVQVCHRDCP